MHLIGPAYDEAMERIVERLQGLQLDVENQELWNFVEQRRTGRQGRHLMIDSRSTRESFHRDIEAKLRAVGALKYEWRPPEVSGP